MTQQTSHAIVFTLGDRLRKARTEAGLDQQELADRICVSRGTVINYELGHGKRPPKIIVLRAWAKECDVPYEELMSDTAQGPGRTTHQKVPLAA